VVSTPRRPTGRVVRGAGNPGDCRRVVPGIERPKPVGRPEDIVPTILDQILIDERVPVTSGEAHAICVRLARAGFFVGQLSGAYMAGLERVARRERRGRFVTLFNDLGERDFSTRLWD